jgi:hypothetical protein
MKLDKQLDKMADEEILDGIRRVMVEFDHHVQEEENVLFLLLLEHCTKSELQRMEERWVKKMEMLQLSSHVHLTEEEAAEMNAAMNTASKRPSDARAYHTSTTRPGFIVSAPYRSFAIAPDGCFAKGKSKELESNRPVVNTVNDEMHIGGTKSPHPHNLLDMIRADHDDVKVLYAEYLICNDFPRLKALAHRIIGKVRRHQAIEEDVVYSRIGEEGNLFLHDKLMCQHQQVRELLMAVDVHHLNILDNDKKLRHAMDHFFEHVDFEEDNVLKPLKAKYHDEELRTLGEHRKICCVCI